MASLCGTGFPSQTPRPLHLLLQSRGPTAGLALTFELLQEEFRPAVLAASRSPRAPLAPGCGRNPSPQPGQVRGTCLFCSAMHWHPLMTQLCIFSGCLGPSYPAGADWSTACRYFGGQGHKLGSPFFGFPLLPSSAPNPQPQLPALQFPRAYAGTMRTQPEGFVFAHRRCDVSKDPVHIPPSPRSKSRCGCSCTTGT